MRTIAPGLVSVLVLSAACATGSGRTSAELSPLLRDGWRPVDGQACRLVSLPSGIAAADVLVDRGRLSSILASRGEAAASGYAVFEVSYDSLGVRRRAAVVESDMDTDAAASLGEALATRLDPSARGSALVRIDAGDIPTVRTGAAEYCACALLNRRSAQLRMNRTFARVRDPALRGTTHQLVVEVRSDTLGNIIEKRFQRVSTHPEIMARASEFVHTLEVAPPLLNRRPVNGWSRIPLTVTIPR